MLWFFIPLEKQCFFPQLCLNTNLSLIISSLFNWVSSHNIQFLMCVNMKALHSSGDEFEEGFCPAPFITTLTNFYGV